MYKILSHSLYWLLSNEHILDRNVILISHLKLLHLLLKDAYKKLSMLANDDQKLK